MSIVSVSVNARSIISVSVIVSVTEISLHICNVWWMVIDNFMMISIFCMQSRNLFVIEELQYDRATLETRCNAVVGVQ